MSKDDSHRDERRVMLLRARFEADLQHMMDYATQTPSGRPMFHIVLSPEQQLERWLNPETRLAVEEGILRTGGPEELRKYKERMLSFQYKA